MKLFYDIYQLQYLKTNHVIKEIILYIISKVQMAIGLESYVCPAGVWWACNNQILSTTFNVQKVNDDMSPSILT